MWVYPYSTALWQVGDLKEQNGSFNINMTKEKAALVARKGASLMKADIKPTNLVPLINRAWEKSFARVEKTKRQFVILVGILSTITYFLMKVFDLQ